MTVAVETAGARRARLAAGARAVVEGRWFDPAMLVVIALNAVALGLETSRRSTRRSAASCARRTT